MAKRCMLSSSMCSSLLIVHTNALLWVVDELNNFDVSSQHNGAIDSLLPTNTIIDRFKSLAPLSLGVFILIKNVLRSLDGRPTQSLSKLFYHIVKFPKSSH